MSVFINGRDPGDEQPTVTGIEPVGVGKPSAHEWVDSKGMKCRVVQEGKQWVFEYFGRSLDTGGLKWMRWNKSASDIFAAEIARLAGLTEENR